MSGAGRFFAGLCGGLALFGSAAVLAQQTPEQVKADAKAFAKTLIPGVKATATNGPTPNNLPNYQAGTPAEAALYNDPDNLHASGEAAAASSAAYGQMQDSMNTRAKFQKPDLDAVVARSLDIQDDPKSLVSNYTDGAEGSCKPLPPGSGGTIYDEVTCNTGTKIEESSPICRVPLVVTVTPGSSKYVYTCENWSSQPPRAADNSARRCQPAFNAVVASGVCRERSRQTVFYDVCRQGTITKCFEPDLEEGEEITYECDTASVSRPYTVETVGGEISDRKDEGSCNAATASLTCDLASEICVDASPETRTINGAAVTRACWQWQRTYSCHRLSAANDCGVLESRPECSFVREQCLDDPPQAPCQVTDEVYRCPVPDTISAEQQYICDGDVYCINGECETIERTPNTEFGQAVMALNSVADASHALDPANLTIFKGTRDTCSKTIFGITNCCAPRGIPIIGGGCGSEDKVLKDKREKGLCHYVGTYCSSSVLGICTKKKEAHCCYGSKLARIIQEQGRPQLGLGFGSAKSAKCEGFTVDQFAHLDLSRLDFAEVMAEFVEAARLPDELQTATEVQNRINEYSSAHL
ncbi:conjugal transfer protein TraN [Sphingomonas sp. BIUV-7]|uniref:Conjugal transfer protein TraN n=1 Tax=Sphingomonas natans TaxID=3063330 RepID=A0ABT8Y9N1_9SPHN|nr:conjugal transfer protein TraN [Sphingomonas sp. BIUV-7]MDO6414404.1 conjugal transfer protein TraN [Sphingomonas sp. BIUV-7]